MVKALAHAALQCCSVSAKVQFQVHCSSYKYIELICFAMLLNNVLVMVLWFLFAVAVSHESSSCVGCMEENMLLQVVKEQQLDMASWQYRPVRRHRNGRFRRFRRYGAKTTERITSTSATSTTTSISSTSLVCGGNAGNGQAQILFEDSGPLQNPVTLTFVPANSNCLCVGGTGNDALVPGYLSVEVRGFSNPFEIGFISISSPNGTEITLQAALFGDLSAGTVAFNGFSAVGDWTIKVLDDNRSLVTQNASAASWRFGLQDCNRISPAADCFGNFADGRVGLFSNRSLVGINLSSTGTVVQFHADLPPSCCLTTVSPSGTSALLYFPFSNSLESGGLVRADGRSPEPGNAEFNLTELVDDGDQDVLLVNPIPEIAGNFAAGLWNFNISTSGFDAVIGYNDQSVPFDPLLGLSVEPCP